MKVTNTNLFNKTALVVCLTSVLYACGGSSSNSATNSSNSTGANSTNTTGNNSGSTGSTGNATAADELGISAVPSSLSGTYTSALNFDRYTSVDTPSGGKIHIVAQNQVTKNQIVRARNILQHFLTDYPGSIYGNDKSAVANKMSDNGAILMLLNGVDDGTNSAAELDGQPLYYGEMQVEGSDWYIQQNYEHRDASYEEILHLVHDYGIGVDQNTQFIGALPEYQADIRAAQTNAVSAQLWAWSSDFASWLTELTAENSLTQEYLASVIDSYYGLWGAYSGEYGMWGGYIAKTREDILVKDTQGADLMNNKFFHPYLTYNARIDESFVGDFSLKFNAELAYTHHSRYLKDITLTGTNDSNVIVNELDNSITGNAGLNSVQFTGNSSEYEIVKDGEKVTVKDMQDYRDGENTLMLIEQLKFTDTTMEVSSL